MSLDNQDPTRSQKAGEAISALTVRQAPFSERNTTTWFLQAEAQFQLARIASQVNIIMLSELSHRQPQMKLPTSSPRFATAVKQRITTSDQHKSALLERTAASERARTLKLLSSEGLGDRRPSQLLLRMTQLLGAHAHAMGDTLLRELFLQHLPSNVQMVLTTPATCMLSPRLLTKS